VAQLGAAGRGVALCGLQLHWLPAPGGGAEGKAQALTQLRGPSGLRQYSAAFRHRSLKQIFHVAIRGLEPSELQISGRCKLLWKPSAIHKFRSKELMVIAKPGPCSEAFLPPEGYPSLLLTLAHTAAALPPPAMAAAQEALRGLVSLSAAMRPHLRHAGVPFAQLKTPPLAGAPQPCARPRCALRASALVAAPSSGALVSRSAEALERMRRRGAGAQAATAPCVSRKGPSSGPVVRGALGGGGSKEVGRGRKPLRTPGERVTL